MLGKRPIQSVKIQSHVKQRTQDIIHPGGTREPTPIKSMASGLSSSSCAFLCQSSWAAGATHAAELRVEHVLAGHPQERPGCEELWLEFQLPSW